MSDEPTRVVWLGPGEAAVTAEQAGSKATGIWRIGKLGLRTPPAFALPIELCAVVNSNPADAAQLVAGALRSGIERLEASFGRNFGDARAPLLVSVRSGAAKSMPGMLSTVLNVGLGPEAVHGLIRLTGDPRFAWDTYRRFIESYAVVVGGAPLAAFARSLTEMIRVEAASDESELDGEALERLTAQFNDIASRQSGRAIPLDPMDQLTEAALAVYRSWESRKAQEYRRLNGLETLTGTAVTVQAMVFGNNGGGSGAGVAFSRNPATGEKGLYVDFLVDAQGEDVVSGRRTPMEAQELALRFPNAFEELTHGAALLEREFRDVQDIEFTIDAGSLFFLQTRSAKRTPRAALQIAVDMVHEGLIDSAEALRRLDAVDLRRAAITRFSDAADADARGIPAAPGVTSGRAAFDSASAKTLAAAGDPVILVRREPATEDIEGFAAAEGVLTEVGGRTAHAAVVARQMAKVCIVGCGDLQIDEAADEAKIAGHRLVRGDWLSLDGETGEVSLGRRAVVSERPKQLGEVEGWRAAIAQTASTEAAGGAPAPSSYERAT